MMRYNNRMLFQRMKKITISLLCIVSTYVPCIQAHALDDHSLTNEIQADYAIVIDRDTGQVLSEKNADEKMYPASMTKMMTAILAIENLADLNQTVTITSEMLDGLMDENATVAGFIEGDQPTVQDLLYGIALPSGADACNAVAYTISGSIDAFVELMNQKASEIGMNNTHFVTVTGIHDDDHYSTARDIATLLQYCLQSETFKTVFSSHSYTTTGTLISYPAGLQLTNTIWDSSEYYGISLDGLIGGKTGFTYPAAYCLASWEDVNDMHLISVVAHCDTDESITYAPHLIATNSILNQLSSSWNSQVILTTDTTVASVTVTHAFGQDEVITVKAPEEIKLDLPNDAEAVVTCTLPERIQADSTSQNLEGDLTISVNDEVLYTTRIMVQIPKESSLIGNVILYLKKHF